MKLPFVPYVWVKNRTFIQLALPSLQDFLCSTDGCFCYLDGCLLKSRLKPLFSFHLVLNDALTFDGGHPVQSLLDYCVFSKSGYHVNHLNNCS